ncbi:DUF397 domain-containing protein [Streptomyces flaveus]|uniref:DUF397 domain-containing protein n=1 Tax=Streptomyces flaveus TaxID=66370 RepID=A0A917R6F6_9ACTN|nr:DUF397 domain-containing protein [Streptomyces flaveus]GGK91547.1 hypothetical protein GCM10010094_60590 [Streptomyces flaveus]
MSAYAWQKSTYCSEGDSCVHVAARVGTVHLTESSDPTEAILETTPTALSALLHTLKHKEETHRG